MPLLIKKEMKFSLETACFGEFCATFFLENLGKIRVTYTKF